MKEISAVVEKTVECMSSYMTMHNIKCHDRSHFM